MFMAAVVYEDLLRENRIISELKWGQHYLCGLPRWRLEKESYKASKWVVRGMEVMKGS